MAFIYFSSDYEENSTSHFLCLRSVKEFANALPSFQSTTMRTNACFVELLLLPPPQLSGIARVFPCLIALQELLQLPLLS